MKLENHYHVIIVGAGPGGLACASLLTQEGVNVLVLERSTHIGRKTCAGGVTWTGLARYLPDKLIEKSFPDQHIQTGSKEIVISSPTPIISTINRQKLGRWMAEKALQAGATIQTGIHVRGITDKKVITATDTFSYNFLVGADGSNSLVRRYLGIPVEKTGSGVQYQIRGNFNEMVWHLEPDQFSTGYAWIFPHKDSASIGAYANRADMSPGVLKEKLHQWMAFHGITAAGLKAEAANINFDYRGFRFGNTFLVGDAAGLASGLTGEGIYSAVCSGEAAARTILDPAYVDDKLTKLIKKHRKHTRLLMMCGINRQVAKVILTTIMTALKMKILHFSSLEMGE